MDYKTSVYALFYIISSKLWEKNLLLKIKGMRGRNTEELQKPFKYFALFYSVGKKMRLLRLFSPKYLSCFE